MKAKKLVISLCDYSGRWAKPWYDAGYNVFLIDTKHPIDGAMHQSERADGTLKTHMKLYGDVTTFHQSAVFAMILSSMEKHRANGGDTDVVVLAAPPCTEFSVSGAQYWPAKDADGRTETAAAMVRGCLAVAAALGPHCRVWALENPRGRINKVVPELGAHAFLFHPHYFAKLEDASLYAPGSELGDLLRRRFGSALPEYWEAYTKETKLWGNFASPDTETHRVEPVRYCSQGSWLQLLGGKSERTKTLRSMTPSGFAEAFFRANALKEVS